MTHKSSKIFMLFGICLFLLGAPIDPTSIIAPDIISEKNITNLQSNPKTAETYDPLQERIEGSNVGLIMNASASSTRTITTSNWNYQPPNIYYTPNWRLELPGRQDGILWKLQQGTVNITGLEDQDNYIPGYGSGSPNRYNAFQAVGSDQCGWTYGTPISYRDNYWTTNNPVNYTDQSLSYALSTTDTAQFRMADDKNFDDEGRVGFIQLKPAVRDYTYTMVPERYGVAPTAIKTGDTPPSKTAGVSEYLISKINEAEQSRNNYYSANSERDENSTTPVTSSNWATYNQNRYVSEVKAYPSDQKYTASVKMNTYYRAYYSTSRTITTGGPLYAKVEGGWSNTGILNAQFKMPFWYNDTTTGSHSIGSMGATVKFNKLGNYSLGSTVFNDPINGITGGLVLDKDSKIIYSIIDNSGKVIGNPISYDLVNGDEGPLESDTVGTLTSGGDFGTSADFIGDKMYFLAINVTIRMKTSGVIQKTGNTIADGSSGTSTVNIPIFDSTDGIECEITNPWVRIRESVKYNDISKSGSVEHCIDSTEIPWKKHTILEESPKLTFGYQINSEMVGVGSSLSFGKVMAKLTLTYNDNSKITFEAAGSDFYQLYYSLSRHNDFTWELNPTIKKSFNTTLSTFKISVGVQLTKDFELPLGTSNNARIYFSNINFTMRTTPDPGELGLKLRYINNGEPSSLLTFTNYGSYALTEIPRGHSITSTYFQEDGSSINDWFRFELDGGSSSAQFTYQISFIANYSNWETTVELVTTKSGITYIEYNQTFITPKPYTYGDYYDGEGNHGQPIDSTTSFTTFWNDNFNIFLVIPKYQIQDDSNIYWKLEWGFDKTNPDTLKNFRKPDHLNYSTWNELTHIYREIAPPNIFGDKALNFGKIQVLHINNLAYNSYTSFESINHGAPYMEWDFLFTIPNELGNIMIDSDDRQFNSYTKKEFYADTGVNQEINIQVNKKNTISTTDANCTLTYKWENSTGDQLMTNVIETTSGISSAGLATNIDEGLFRAGLNSTYKGKNCVAKALYTVKDATKTGRTTGDEALSGTYRAGYNYTLFDIIMNTTYMNFDISNTTFMKSPNSSPEANTWLYNTTELDPAQSYNNMILKFEWIDNDTRENIRIDKGDVRISVFNFANWINNLTHPKVGISQISQTPQIDYLWDNIPMIENATKPGEYYITFDPRTMNHGEGNISAGYHPFTITCSRDGYNTLEINGNFSILITTIMTISSDQADPDKLVKLQHNDVFADGVDYYHHYDEMMSGRLYDNLFVTYYIADTPTAIIYGTIDDGANNYYSGKVRLCYELINVRKFSDITTILDMAEYVNEAYFQQSSDWDDQTSAEGWPSKGILTHTGSGYTARFTWPSFNVDEYSAGLDYADQDEQINRALYEYQLNATVRVNRTYDTIDPTNFQPHDVQIQITEGLGDAELLDQSPETRKTEESFLLKLEDSAIGNFTRIMLFNNETKDGEAFSFRSTTFNGIYENDSLYADDWAKTSEYNPTYQIVNYQNNETHNEQIDYQIEAGRFRLRVLVNCSFVGKLGENVYLSGRNDTNMYLMGPVNEGKTTPWGEEYEYIGTTKLALTGLNGSIINFTADDTVTWNASVPSLNLDGTIINYTGITYYSDWIYLNTIQSGKHEAKISFVKDSYVPTNQKITVIILDAPSVVLNGSKNTPDIEDDQYTILDTSKSLNFTTPIGIPGVFYVNYTDITNYATLSKTANITGANLEIYSDDLKIWKNGTNGIQNNPKWYYEEISAGLYKVNITFTALGSERPVELYFKIQKNNYQSQEFLVVMQLTKRETNITKVADVSSDYYYEWSSIFGENSELLNSLNYMSHIKIELELIDVDAKEVIDYNTSYFYKTGESRYAEITEYIDMYYSYEGRNFEILDESYYKLIQNGNSSFNITFGSHAIPGVYILQFRFNDHPIFKDSTFNHTVEIKPGKSDVIFNEEISKFEVPYYYSVDNYNVSADENYLPLYQFNFIDSLHRDIYNNSIQYYPDPITFRITSNWSNEHRTGTQTAYKLDKTNGRDYKTSTTELNEKYYSTFILDIMGIECLYTEDFTGYFSQTVNVTFNRTYFEPKSVLIEFTIVNVTTKILDKFYENPLQNQLVLVKSEEFNKDYLDNIDKTHTTSKYSSKVDFIEDIPYINPIYYDFLVFTYIGYYGIGTKNTNSIKNETAEDPLRLSIICDDPTIGITFPNPVLAGDIVNGHPMDHSVIYFQANPTKEVDYINLTFYISKDNYQPIQYRLIFRISDHITAVKSSIDRSITYGGILQWEVDYADYSSGVGVAIDDARIFCESEPNGVGPDESGTYIFPDGTAMAFDVNQNFDSAHGKYYIDFYTENLSVRDLPYEVNLTIGKAHYEYQQIISAVDRNLPYFTVTPVKIQLEIILTTSEYKPTESDNRFGAFTINPTQNDRFYIWVRAYVEIKQRDIIRSIPLDGEDIKINATMSHIITNEEGKQEIEELYAFDLYWDDLNEIFTTNLTLKYGIDKELLDINLITFTPYSLNDNFESKSYTMSFVVQKVEDALPDWFWILATFTIGSAMLIAGYGLKKALQLRIPYVLRMIDESIEKITNDKFPSVGVMLGRREFVINKVIDYLDEVGIEWEISDKFQEEQLGEEGEEEEESTSGSESAKPMDLKELTVELNKIENLGPDDRELFLEELKRLNRKEQEEFLKSLREDKV